jgi:hypothetical protein
VKRVEFFQTEVGFIPFKNWHDGLDKNTKHRVTAYLDRIALGGSRKNIRSNYLK